MAHDPTIDLDAVYTLIRRVNRTVGVSRSFPSDDQEDAVQWAAYRVVADKVLGRARNWEAFVRVMLHRHYLDELRRRRRLDPGDALDTLPGRPVEEEETPDAELHQRRLAAVRRQLEAAASDALSRRAERNRERGRKVWSHMVKLAFEGATLVEVLKEEEGIDESSPAAVRLAAENRAYKAAERFRTEMAEAISAAEREGRLTGREADFRRRCLVWLRRNDARRRALG